MSGNVSGAHRLAPGAARPQFPVRTVANTRRDQHADAETLDIFERGLSEVEWFAHLGEPSPWDNGCARISAWAEWPGPENALVEAFALTFQNLRDLIFKACPPPAVDHLQVLFDRVSAAAVRHASAVVPSFDPAEDAWHAPTQCAWDAGYVAALVACVLACGWPVPEDLAEVWNWYNAGHWPSGFAREPSDDPAERQGDQLVFPSRLLVY